MLIGELNLALELAGVAVFALTGALTAARKSMDPFGFALLATVTGVGGRTLRDLLLGTQAAWITSPIDIVTCVGVAALALTLGPASLGKAQEGPGRAAILWGDAVGLALFAVMGAQKALAAGAAPISAVALGVMTATFGGILRDLLAVEPPLILRREI